MAARSGACGMGSRGRCTVTARIVPFVKIAHGHRPGDKIALRHVAAHFRKQAQGRLVFHTFGNRLETEVVREVDGRARDRTGARVGQHPAHERLIHLDRIDGQLLQIGQRRLSRAEVVDVQRESKIVKSDQHRARVFRIFHQGALGEFERHLRGRDAPCGA